MRLIALLTFLVMSLEVCGQFESCDSLVIRGHQTSFDVDGIHSTFDFINKYFPNKSRYVTDRNELKSINLWLNADSTMLFKDQHNEIRVTFTNGYIDPTDIFYPKSKREPFSRIREYTKGSPFGITSEDTTVVFLAEINVNGNKIPTTYFSDLLNPSQFETILSVKPIEVFESKCGNYLFIYLFGKPNAKIMTLNEAIEFSYMAKIVVSIKGYYIDRIVIPGDKLKHFGYGECPNFIGF